jgi:hypothetical protein
MTEEWALVFAALFGDEAVGVEEIGVRGHNL